MKAAILKAAEESIRRALAPFVELLGTSVITVENDVPRGGVTLCFADRHSGGDLVRVGLSLEDAAGLALSLIDAAGQVEVALDDAREKGASSS